MRGRAHHAFGVLRKQLGAGADQTGLDQRLVALHVDDEVVAVEAEQFARFGEAVAAGRMIGARQQRTDAMSGASSDDVRVIGGDDDAACA